MSTYLYLKCPEHDPPLIADGESGQHLYDLDQIREDIFNREHVVWATNQGMQHDWDHFRRNTARFLAQHPRCEITVEDEYGCEHPITEDGEP